MYHLDDHVELGLNDTKSNYWNRIERPFSRPAYHPLRASNGSEAGLGNARLSIHSMQQPAPPFAVRPEQSFTNVDALEDSLTLSHLLKSEPSYSIFADHSHDSTLDAYDRALLAESQPQLPQENSNKATIVRGRLSLPGHTAPSSTVQYREQKQTPERRRNQAGLRTQGFKQQLDRFVHTPPNQKANAPSSDKVISSSPLARVSRRPLPQIQPSGSSHLKRSPKASPILHRIPPNTSKTRSFLPSKSEETLKAEDDDAYGSGTISVRDHDVRPVIATPVIQGTALICLNEIPDRFRSVFPFNPLNLIQSRCFPTAYQTDDNLVVSAPTGGGKTAIFELAICRLVSVCPQQQFKIVYMAPTKSLCSERQRDWQAKFATLDLQCAQLTGDTDHAHLKSVQSAQIVITTPEKWDSMTRQWKDHARLMELVKLFLIDEVHILKDSRGATLEAVISRMKSVGSSVRFIALSATVPNTEDVATWLGKDQSNPHLPAVEKTFGEEFRPVKLQKHVIGIPYKGNDYGLEGPCDLKLPEIITKYSKRKPVMIFCITRRSAVSTAKNLATLWASSDLQHRQWQGPNERIVVGDPELSRTLLSAVAFHHAGLDGDDRQAVEKGFLTGVNLPCHLVIVKNTVSYQGDGLKEYADLEIVQMLGRAGRPQFDDSAVAVILTKNEKVGKYEKLVSGSELLESSLHLNLTDHLNAEIGLGTIHDLDTAKRWLAGTFLYVRLGRNPGYYQLHGDRPTAELEEKIESICRKDIELLKNAALITCYETMRATELGNIMTRYYVNFDTMRIFLALGARPKLSDILSAIVQAAEYNDIRFRSFEKRLFKEINNSNGIKFPIKVDLATHAQKRSLLIQSELGGVEFPGDEQYVKHQRQFHMDKTLLFANAHRLIRCIVDIQLHFQDAVGTRNSLELARSLSAKVWDTSPFQMKQLPQIGAVTVRKLVLNGIASIEALEGVEAQRLDLLLSKNPPFGSKLLSSLKEFPKLRVSIKLIDKKINPAHPVSVKLRIECGFINEKIPIFFKRDPVHVCLLTERSDGHLLDFRRISAKKLDNGQTIIIPADLINHTQYITCYVMCDAIAGTLRYAELKPGLPAYSFPVTKIQTNEFGHQASVDGREMVRNDEYGLYDIDDKDLLNTVGEAEFYDIDKLASAACIDSDMKTNATNVQQGAWRPERLANGKWACNHRCKDKTVCRHMCCRDGLDKLPKAPKTFPMPASESTNARMPAIDKGEIFGKSCKVHKSTSVQTTIAGKKRNVDEIDLAGEQRQPISPKRACRSDTTLVKLHQSMDKAAVVPVAALGDPTFATSKTLQSSLCCSDDAGQGNPAEERSTNYCDPSLGDLPSPTALLNVQNDAIAALSNRTKFIDQTGIPNEDPNNASSPQDYLLSSYETAGNSPTRSDRDEPPKFRRPERVCTPTDEIVGISNQEKPDNYNEDSGTLQSVQSAGLRNITSYTLEQDDEDHKSETSLMMDQQKRTSLAHSLRQNDDRDMVPEMKITAQDSTVPQPSDIRSGMPAWVYDFDTAFIEEYRDVVDFV